MFSRRQVLLGMGVVSVGAAAPWLWHAGRNTGTPQPVYFSAFDDDAGKHHLAVLDGAGGLLFRQPVPERAHSTALSTDGRQLIFFARRPGRLAWQIDLHTKQLVRTLHAQPGRHFYGHGSFSPDGRLLYTSENDFENARGVITVRDLESGEALREFDSGGIGPHDLRLMPDGETLVVANGGLQTHPGRGREPLNIESMQPSLTYLDRRSGEVLEQVAPPHHQLSTRHLWITPDGEVAVVMQYQGPITDAVPLVGFHRRGQLLRTALAPLATQRHMRAYTASVCVHPQSRVALVTCPRGNIITLWEASGARFIKALPLSDAGGVSLSATSENFLVSTGSGQIIQVTPDGRQQTLVRPGNTHWDNHLAGPRG